jgi:uncharacterized protein (TIGR00297 family)
MLVGVFVLTWVATRWGYAAKQQRGTAEKGGGRTASQVLANLGVAGACAAGYAWGRTRVWVVAMAASLAEAAADTVASEIGQAASDRAVLITTWQTVPAGTDGGISVAGTLAGVVAALLVGLVGAATGQLDGHGVGVVVVAASAGVMADSLLGAWLERAGLIGNDAVNASATALAAVLAAFLYRWVS